MTNDEAEKLLDEAEDLLRTAWAAMLKMGLRDRGSDIGLSHEVRMFAAHFSEEGRDGPGALQIRGTGRFRAWLKAHREARNAGVAIPRPAEPETGGMTISKALRQGLKAEPWLAGGTGPVACVGICAIQLQGWWHTAESAKQWADGYNRAIEHMRAAYGVKEVPDAGQ